MKYLSKPYFLFLPAIIFVFILCVDELKAKSFLSDTTELSFGNIILYCFFIVLLSSLLTLYIFTRRLLYSSVLTWIHVILTITFIFILLKTATGHEGFAGMPRRYYDYSEAENSIFFSFEIVQLKMNIRTLVLLVLTQVIYFFNLGIGSFKSAITI